MTLLPLSSYYYSFYDNNGAKAAIEHRTHSVGDSVSAFRIVRTSILVKKATLRTFYYARIGESRSAI